MVVLAQESQTGEAPDGFPISAADFAEDLVKAPRESLTSIATLEHDIRRNTADVVVARQLEHTRSFHKFYPEDAENDAVADKNEKLLLVANEQLFKVGIDTYQDLFDKAEEFLDGARTPEACVAARYLMLQELSYSNFQLMEGYQTRAALEQDPIGFIQGLDGDALESSEPSEAEIARFKARTVHSIHQAVGYYAEAVKALDYVDGFAVNAPLQDSILA